MQGFGLIGLSLIGLSIGCNQPPTTLTTTTPAGPTIPVSQCKCGQANVIRTKIVGGQETEKNEYPWQVALLKSQEPSSTNKPYCAGSLISNQEVLTAAQCLIRSTIYVALGEHDTNDPNDGQKIVKVCSSTKHPSYRYNGNNDFDYAILKLCDSPVTFTKEISPVCLPTANSLGTQYENVDAIVSGWGTTSSGYGGIQSSTLLDVTVTTMNNSQCKTSYEKFTITDNMICAAATGKDACKGDSGGPLIRKESNAAYTLIGIVSWGLECAQVNIKNWHQGGHES
ncbi:chymotrypsin-like protease CTRL-1 [Eurytemora carolleeae]|uniref:chymotrypsin-like protease CTRL-1 n=1 Tax=Eurytemora carolleeae TaxID=1294199 RepID=UPI000C765CFB|nr:chymotrypsin-like protease CTRL-1 [Eurytemora carolleeae]|eukprot:XP_023341079.1 chymotrypsin-like protease CTRL-1 [Eurytemora affinis]